MYNEEIKLMFIDVRFPTRKIVGRSFFNKYANFEEEHSRDIYDLTKSEIVQMIEETGKTASETTKNSSISIIRSYLRWCQSKGIEIRDPSVLNTGKIPWNAPNIKMCSVYSPEDLQIWLNKIFKPDTELCIDCTYRVYYWMTFMGIDTGDMPKIEEGNMDLNRMLILFEGKSYDIPLDAIEAFRICRDAKSFVKVNPGRKPYMIDRYIGKQLLRGTASINWRSFKTLLEKKANEAYKQGLVDKSLTYSWVKKSGIFYRKYIQGDENVDFTEETHVIAREAMRKENVSIINKKKNINAANLSLKKDYERWVSAYSEELSQLDIQK